MYNKFEKEYNLIKNSKPGKGLKYRDNDGTIFHQSTEYRYLPAELRQDFNQIGLNFQNKVRFVYKGDGTFKPSGDRYLKWQIDIEETDVIRSYEFFEGESRYDDIYYLIRDKSIMNQFSKTIEHNWIYEFGLSKTSSEYDEEGAKSLKNEQYVIRGTEGLEFKDRVRRKWDYFYRPLKQPINDFYSDEIENSEKDLKKSKTKLIAQSTFAGIIVLFGLYLMGNVSQVVGGLSIFFGLLYLITISKTNKKVLHTRKLVRTLKLEQEELLSQFPDTIPSDEEMQQYLKEDLEHILINEVKKKNMFDSMKNALGPGSSLSQKWAQEQGCIEIVELGFFQPSSITKRSHQITNTKLRTIRLTSSGELLGRIYALLFIFPTSDKLVIHSSIFDFVTMKLMNEFNIDFYYKDIIQIKDEVWENKSNLIEDERDNIQEILTLNLEFAGGQTISIAHPLEESLKYLEKEMKQFEKSFQDSREDKGESQNDLKGKQRINYEEIKRKSQRARQIANFLRTTWNENLLATETPTARVGTEVKLDSKEVSDRIWDALENPYKF